MFDPATRKLEPSERFVRDPERAVATTVLHLLPEFPRE
jgi:hypothetical protein